MGCSKAKDADIACLFCLANFRGQSFCQYLGLDNTSVFSIFSLLSFWNDFGNSQFLS